MVRRSPTPVRQQPAGFPADVPLSSHHHSTGVEPADGPPLPEVHPSGESCRALELVDRSVQELLPFCDVVVPARGVERDGVDGDHVVTEPGVVRRPPGTALERLVVLHHERDAPAGSRRTDDRDDAVVAEVTLAARIDEPVARIVCSFDAIDAAADIALAVTEAGVQRHRAGGDVVPLERDAGVPIVGERLPGVIIHSVVAVAT